MGFAEALTMLFVAYKVTGVIDWPWWLVFLPESCAVIFYAVVFVAIVMAHTPTKQKQTKRRN